MCGKQPSNVAIVADLAPSAWALGKWKSFWKVGGLTTSGSADGLRQWTFLTVEKFWFPEDIWNEVSASDFGLWLKHEAVTKENAFSARNYIFGREWDLIEAGVNQPQRLDDTDCGVFVCINSDCIAGDLIMSSHLYTSAADVYGHELRTKRGCDIMRGEFLTTIKFLNEPTIFNMFTCWSKPV